MGEVGRCVRAIRKKFEEMLKEKRPEKCVSIFKAPLVLAEKNKKAYIPKWVSVGPYHHKAAHLSSDMETQKMRAVHRFMSKLNREKASMSIFDEIVGELKTSESEIRKRYEIDIECDGDYLAHMMAFDGCFVLEILRCLSDEAPNADRFFNRHKIEYSSYSLLTDILLLENQIPLFVLINLLKLEMKSDMDAKRKLSQILIDCGEVGRVFYPFIVKKEKLSRQLEKVLDTGEEPAHLLDLVLRLARGDYTQLEYAATEGRSKSEEKDSLPVPTATELKEVGIKFEACEGGLKRVCFSEEKRTLQLPKINVSASAGIFLRNLMAYEICQSPNKRIISNFAVLMDELINTDKDVALLRKKGIIHSYTLGSDKEVAAFFNDLRQGTVAAGSSSMDLFRAQRKKIRGYYHSKYRVMFAEFMRLHFSKPWQAASAVAAVLLLLLTLLQTIYAIKGTTHMMKEN